MIIILLILVLVEPKIQKQIPFSKFGKRDVSSFFSFSSSLSLWSPAQHKQRSLPFPIHNLETRRSKKQTPKSANTEI
ncbi:unnamed protein product [Citrullus colocynthis]|uniref:Uncharacterized protein n=1 Tax=Citrullus colocynthis TaxID=252529 RepID=A0ABP0Z423_9ROSI